VQRENLPSGTGIAVPEYAIMTRFLMCALEEDFRGVLLWRWIELPVAGPKYIFKIRNEEVFHGFPDI
jgi:hypothetical protein